tara:strand:+ start:2540 stop:7621 length:5082 start_codon:yes stop_codon:yes gene_type:complete
MLLRSYLLVIGCLILLTGSLNAQAGDPMVIDCLSQHALRHEQVDWPKYTPEKFDGDTTRLAFKSANSKSYVLWDAGALTGEDQLRGFECLTYSFGGTKSLDIMPLVLEVAMVDQPDAYQRVVLVKSPPVGKFPGNRTSQIYRTQPDVPAFRYVRLHMENLEQTWQVVLGQIRFSVDPMPALVIAKSKPAKPAKTSEKTVSVKQDVPNGVVMRQPGQWLVDFNKQLPVTYKQANWTEYQSERYDKDATRIRFKQSGSGSHVIFDVQRLTGMDQATDLQLAVYGFASTWKTFDKSCIIEVSADGVNYQTLPTVQSPRIKKVPSGRTLVYLRPDKATAPFRYVRIHLENIKQTWHVGLTNLLLTDKTLADFVPVFDVQGKDALPKVEDKLQTSAIQLPVYPLPNQMRRPKLITLMQGICFDTSDVMLDQLDIKKIAWQKADINPLSYYGVHWQIENQDNNAKCALYRVALDVTATDLSDRIVMVFPQTFFMFDVYLDGKPVAQNLQGMAYTEVDLTKHLQKAGQHELLIKVRDYYAGLKSGKVVLPIGAQYRYRRGFERAPMIERRPVNSMVQPFVWPDIDKQQVTASVNLTQGDKHADQLRITILDKQQQAVVQKTFSLDDEQMPTVTLDVQDHLAMWDIGKPNLYDCQFTLFANGKVLDQITTRFGYRTVSTRGEDILLNGRKIQLIGPWAHIGEWTRSRGWVEKTDDYKADLVNVYKTMLSQGINYGRLHCQIFDRIFYEAADEAGFMLVAESGLNHRPKNQAALDHIKQMTLQLRNHPAIVMWSGSNEFEHWITPRPTETEAFMVKVQEVHKQYDPSRLVQHSGYGDAQGKIDLYNIHYPDGNGKEFPNSFYWKGLTEQFNHLYSDNYTHFQPDGKKPIGIGEHLTPKNKLILDHVYGDRMLYLRNGDPTNFKNYITYQGDFWRQAVRSYREQNVALLSPNFMYLDHAIHSNFLKELSKELKPQTAYWRQMNPDLKTGQNHRELLLFEHSGHPFEGYAQLACKVADQVLWEQRLPVSLNASQRLSQSISIELPAVQADVKGTLSSTLLDTAGNEVYSMHRDVMLYASIQTNVLAGRMVYGLDVPVEMVQLLSQWQIQFKALTSVTDVAILPKDATLLVGKDVASEKLQSSAQAIGAFVSLGGKVLMLARAEMPDIFPSQIITRQGQLNGATQGFIRSPHHPFFTQAILPMDDLDFAYWTDDLLVSDDNCYKPISGNFHVLVDGGIELDDALLVELIHGDGRMLVSQLMLDKLDQTPAAAKVLFNLINYLTRSSPRQQRWGIGCYLKGSDAYAIDLLSKLGWQQYDTSLSNIAGLYVDDQSLKQMGADNVAQLAKDVRFVHLHVTDPTRRDRLTKLLVGSSPKQITSPKIGTKRNPIHLLNSIVKQDTLLNGLASGDLNWTTRPQPQPVMFKADSQWEVPVHPGVLAIHRKAGQTILADMASWNQVVDNDERRMRFLCAISTQMGVVLTGRSIRSSSASKVHTVNLKPYCNVSASQYLGPNMPLGQVVLHGIPFDFAKATDQNPATMVRLNARVGTSLEGQKVQADTPIDQFDEITPTSVSIDMARVHASKIYFAHATTYNYRIKTLGKDTNVCQYRINYADGTDAVMNITLKREIQDARKRYEDGRYLLMGTQFLNPKNGDGEMMAIGIYTWENPSPEKKIRSIELIISGQNPHMDPMLFALSYSEFAGAFE